LSTKINFFSLIFHEKKSKLYIEFGTEDGQLHKKKKFLENVGTLLVKQGAIARNTPECYVTNNHVDMCPAVSNLMSSVFTFVKSLLPTPIRIYWPILAFYLATFV
jgi:hypothetical protein